MTVQLAVVGAHLRGQPLNHQLLDLGAVFSRPALTAPILPLVRSREYLASETRYDPLVGRSFHRGGNLGIDGGRLRHLCRGRSAASFDRQYYPQLRRLRERISLRGNRARGLSRYHQLWRMAGVSRAIGQSLASRGRFVWRSRSPYETEDFLIVGLRPDGPEEVRRVQAIFL